MNVCRFAGPMLATVFVCACLALPFYGAHAAMKHGAPINPADSAVARGKYLVTLGRLQRLPHAGQLFWQAGHEQIPWWIGCWFCYSGRGSLCRIKPDTGQADWTGKLDRRADRDCVHDGKNDRRTHPGAGHALACLRKSDEIRRTRNRRLSQELAAGVASGRRTLRSEPDPDRIRHGRRPTCRLQQFAETGWVGGRCIVDGGAGEVIQPLGPASCTTARSASTWCDRCTKARLKTSMAGLNRPSRRFVVAERTSLSLRRQLVVDSFDVPIHAADLGDGEMVAALAFDRGAVLLRDRALEHVQLP
jgi:hypothetical protein